MFVMSCLYCSHGNLIIIFCITDKSSSHTVFKIFMHHEVRCKNYGFTVNNYISTLLYLAMISV